MTKKHSKNTLELGKHTTFGRGGFERYYFIDQFFPKLQVLSESLVALFSDEYTGFFFSLNLVHFFTNFRINFLAQPSKPILPHNPPWAVHREV